MTVLGILGVLALVLVNAFFVVAEYALVTAPRMAVKELADGGSRGARTALTLMDDPVRFIGTVQLGITAVGIGLGALGEPVFRELFDPLVAAWLSFTLAFAIVTYVTVVVGELVPKALALHRAAPIAAFVARPIALLQRLGTPVVWVLQGSARLILRPLGVPAAPAGATVHTVDELRGIVAEAEDSGLIEEAEEEMLYRVFDFAAQEAGDVMVPSSEVVTLDGLADRQRGGRARAPGAAQPLPGGARVDRRRRGRARAARPDGGAARRATSARSSRSRATCSSSPTPRTSARCCRRCARAARRWRWSSASTGARWASSRSTT